MTDEEKEALEEAEALKTQEGQKSETEIEADRVAALLADKGVQGEIDRRVTSALKKARADADARVRETKDKAARDAAEAKLLEDGKLTELLELEKQKRAEAERLLDRHVHTDKVNQLLDKKGVTDPDMRALFHSLSIDLTELDAKIDVFQSKLGTLVERATSAWSASADTIFPESQSICSTNRWWITSFPNVSNPWVGRS